MSNQLSHWDYCQFLLASQTNYTQTYFADHTNAVSHDRVNRLLKGIKLSPKELRTYVKKELVLSENGYVLFDDTVLDKSHSFVIELVRRQWSGNAKKIIKGIGVVTCVYVNPDTNQFWIIDYRIFDPDRDGKTKINHLLDMWQSVIYVDELPFKTVLMDSWYATKTIIKMIEKAEKIYYCPVKSNRNVTQKVTDDYQRVDALTWSDAELECGKTVHLKGLPKEHKVKLFRIVVSTHRTEYVITNDHSQNSADDTRKESAVRWKIEQFHREAKQITGLESCQCRLQRSQRNHIACAMLVWVRFTRLAHKTKTTVYQLKAGLLSDYMQKQLLNPSISMSSA